MSKINYQELREAAERAFEAILGSDVMDAVADLEDEE